MSHGEDDYDCLQSFFPGWREEDRSQGNRNNGGSDQTHHQNPHPAFADAAQMVQACNAAYVRFQESRSPQARAAQLNQQGQISAPYSPGMDQTLLHSELHRDSQYDPPQQHSQQHQSQMQQQYQQHAWQRSLHLPRLQPHKQAQYQAQQNAREQAQQETRERARQQTREQAEQQAREQAELRRYSTPQTTQQKVPETRQRTLPRAPSQSQASSKQPESSRRGSFLEDAALFSTKSPQKEPYTSSSRSSLGPRANTSIVPASTATTSASTKPLAVSHSHPSPKPIISVARTASVSVPPSSSASVSAPAQIRTPDSPPIMSSTPAAAATDRPSFSSSATSDNIKSPAVLPVSYAVPQALRTYATPEMIKAYAATQAQKASTSTQPYAQTVRSICAPSIPSVASKPSFLAAVAMKTKATVPPPTSAQTTGSMSAASASPVNSTPAAPAVSQTHKANAPFQTTTPIARSISALPAPPDNFFRPASNSPTTSSASVPGSSRTVAADSTSTSGRNSPLPSQNRLAGPPRKRGRPPIYPDIMGPVNQPAGPGRAGERWKVHSQTNSSNATPNQFQPVVSGLPVLQNSAHPKSWKPQANPAFPASNPTRPLVKGFEHAPSQFAAGAGAIPRTLPPTRAYQPAKIYTSGPVQPRPASTQRPAAKMRKLDDSSRHVVNPPSSGTLDLGPYVRQSPSRKHITYRSDVVEPMTSSDVLIQLAYNPATIARDILIVADKHPTEKGLNHHLHSLRQNFQAVDHSSDLATFRWDLVDPHVPPVQQSASNVHQTPVSSVTRLETISRPPSSPPNFPGPASAGNGMPHESARDAPTAPLARPAESRPAYNTNTGITSATAITSTGTPNSSLTGSNLNRPGFSGLALVGSGSFSSGRTSADVTSKGVTKTSIGPSYSASSPALDSTSTSISTPTPTSPPKSAQKPTSTPHSAVKLNAFAALPFKPPSYYTPLGPSAQPLPYSLPSLPPSSSPPRVYSPVSSVPSVPTEPQFSVSATVPVSVSAPAPQPSPRKSVKSTSVPSSSLTSAASRPLSKTPQASSKSPRGKAPRQSPVPKGLPEPQVVIPISSQGMAPPKKKPGRPSQKDVQIEVAIDNRPATQYQVFKCKWTGCEAELHNLHAIHTHILGVHIPHHIVCAWEDCTDQNPRAAAAMWDHVREKHMVPLAWQLGDGPSASVTAVDGCEQPELSGQGRQDTMTLPADRDSVKIFSRIHGTQTSKQKAQLMEDGGRRWKEDAGPDTDTSDRPLSTPPRLMASSHNETAYTLSEVRVVI